MCKLSRVGILITFGMFIMCIIGGCGDDRPEEVTATSQSDDDDDPPEEVTDSPQLEGDMPLSPTIKIAVDPASGVHILPTTQFTLTFNEGVIAVTVNDTPAVGSGLNWKWTAEFPFLPYGSVSLKIEWTNRDGSKGFKTVGPYEVVGKGGERPLIVSGTVADGDVDVDPAPTNAGGFRFDFDEPITGIIKLTDEAGADLDWIGNVAGQKATLTAVAGQELVNETTYKIEIHVADGAGNKTQATITFVTKPK